MAYDIMRRRQPAVPVVAYRILEHALAWLTLTFKFPERLRQHDEHGRVVWAEMRAGDGDIMMRRIDDAEGRPSPGPSHVVVYVDEVQTPYEDAVYAAFIDRGDADGNRWTFCELVRTADPLTWGAVVTEEMPEHPDPATCTPTEWADYETARQLLEAPVRMTSASTVPGRLLHETH